MKTKKLHLIYLLTLALFSNNLSAQLEGEVDVNIDSLFASANYYDLNKALKQPEKVYYLDLSMQKLDSLPDSIHIFKNLESLDLSFNRLDSLPSSITQLEKLKFLNLSGCYELESLPEDLKKLKSLEELHIQDMTLPDSVAAMNNAEIQRAVRALPWAKVYFDTPK